jgi:hypothetical protein
MTTTVTEILAKQSSEEKKSLLLELLRELIRQNPRQPISIEDESGKPIGLFAPAPIALKDDVFAEGAPGFFAELERRRQTNDRISAEEALHHLRTHGNQV